MDAKKSFSDGMRSVEELGKKAMDLRSELLRARINPSAFDNNVVSEHQK